MNATIEIICDVFIEASQETVFSYLTEQEKAAQWFGDIVDIEGKPGGKFYVSTNSGVHATGEYTEIVPYEKVVFTWGGMHGLSEGETTVEVILHAEDGGTRLSLRHFDIPLQEAADDFKNGWSQKAFPLIKLVAEGGTTQERCFCDVNACCPDEQGCDISACEDENQDAA